MYFLHLYPSSFYRLPVVSRHDFDLVGRDQVSQQFGDLVEPRPVGIHQSSEEQPAQVRHVQFGAVVVTTQVLGQLLFERHVQCKNEK